MVVVVVAIIIIIITIIIDATFNSLFPAQPDDFHRARFSAVKAPHRGDWLYELPITSELATTRKEAKYVKLSTTHHFVPLAFESLGPIGSKASNFLKERGRRLTLATKNPLETAYLFQRLPVAMQHFNAVCVLGCFDGNHNDVD